MVRVARLKLDGNAEILLGDSEVLPFDQGKFDLVTCTFSFHHYPNPKAAISEMKRVLAAGGKLIIVDPWIFAPLRQVFNLFQMAAHRSARVFDGG